MKYKFSLLAVALAVFGVIRSASAASPFNISDNGNGTCTITGYTGTGGIVGIPLTISNLTVTTIGDFAFKERTSLTIIIISNSVINIGYQAFESCTGLTNVTIGNSVTNITDNAFEECTSLTSIAIPNSVINLGLASFNDCENLTNLTIGNSVTTIGDYAFNFCSRLNNLILPNSVTSLGANAFSYCGLTNATIGAGLTTLSDSAFYADTGIHSITIPNTVTAIGAGTFENSGLNDITIPNSVTSIGPEAFTGSPVFNVILGNSVTNIGIYAFDSTSLTNIVIPASVASIEVPLFESCIFLKAISVNPLNPFYSSVNGVLFDKNQTTLLECPGGLVGSYAIPDGVTSLGDNAFEYCTRLTSITMPNSLTSLPFMAFTACSATNITIGNGVTNIGDYAFESCSLTHITIPRSVTGFGFFTFNYCFSLAQIYFQGDAPAVSSDEFFDDPFLTIYYLPATSGWGPVFNGLPAVLWNPHGKAFNLTAGHFGFNIIGPTNLLIVVETCTNLVNPGWSPVSTNALPASGISPFSDPRPGTNSTRFYRFRSPL